MYEKGRRVTITFIKIIFNVKKNNKII